MRLAVQHAGPGHQNNIYRYNGIINLVQQLNGLLSMPILSVFVVGLLFRKVAPGAAILQVVFGTGLYAVFTFAWTPLHYIHLMLITLLVTIGFGLLVNRLRFGMTAEYAGMEALRRSS